MKLDFDKDAIVFVSKLDAKRFRQVMIKVFAISQNPYQNDTKLLRGHGQFLRSDVGEYRIIYRIEDDTVKISTIGKRNDDEVYKDHERRS